MNSQEGLPHRHESRSIANPKAMQIKRFETGEEILSEGTVPNAFAVVLEGTVGILQKGQLLRTLQPVDPFGLEPILLQSSLPYSAKAYTHCRIAFYAQKALEHFIEENPRMTRSILTSAIKQLSQTAERVIRDMDRFAMDQVQMIFFGPNEILFEENQRGNYFFRLVSTEGGVSLSRQGRQIQTIMDPGHFIGAMNALLGQPREHTATSLGETILEVYDTGSLEFIVRDHPDVALHMIHTILNHYRTPMAQ